MFAFGGMQLTRYKQRVLTRRAHAATSQTINLPNFNDWHLVKVWSVGSGGNGGSGVGSGGSNDWDGAGGGGGGGIAHGRYQADPVIRRDYVCNVGSGNSISTICTFYDSALAANRVLTGHGGLQGGNSNAKNGGGGGGATGGQINVQGGVGGHGAGKPGGGGAIGGQDGADATGGNQNGGAGAGADAANVAGIFAEMTFWGYSTCCGSLGGLDGPGPEAGEGCGGGGGGGRLFGTRRKGTVRRSRGRNGGNIGGGGGGGQRDGGGGASNPGLGGDGHVFIVY